MFNKNSEGPVDETNELIDRYEKVIMDGSAAFFEEEEFEQIVEYYELRNEIEKATEAIDFATQQYPFSAFFMLKKAQFYFDLRKNKKALEMLDKAEAFDATDLEACFLRADILTSEGHFETAINVLESALDMAEDEEKDAVYVVLGDVYEAWEKFDKSYKCLKHALQFNPKNEDALNKIWFIVEIAEVYEDSIKVHQQIIDEDPYSYQAWYNLGQAYFGMELYERATQAYEYVTLINEDYEMPYRNWGEALFRLGDYKKAIEVYYDAMRLTSPYEEIYFGIGKCYDKLMEAGKARFYYRKAIHLDPHFHESFYRIGLSYLHENAFDQSLTAFNKALKIQPDNVDYLAGFADANYGSGLTAEAIDAYHKAVALKPRIIKNWISLTQYLYEQKEVDEALVNIEEAINVCGESADLLFTRGGILYDLGRRNEAVLILEQALLTNFEDYQVLFELLPDLTNDETICSLIELYSRKHNL